MDVKLSDATAAELAKRPIEYDTGFTLLPGKYKIKFLARDAETGRIGTYQTAFVIPNLNKEDKRIPISSVVLSSQRVDLQGRAVQRGEGQGHGRGGQSAGAGRPEADSQRDARVQQESRHVRLSCRRTSGRRRPRIRWWHSSRFIADRPRHFETPPLEVTEALNNRLKTTPLKFGLSLAKLPPGEYNCQVTILDPTTQKAAFWQAPVMLIQ